jgi:peptidoglycan LD-endopeptidase CwlK
MSSRRIEDLCPAVQVKCNEFIEACAKAGIPVLITSTLRMVAEQIALYAQGRQALDLVNKMRRFAGLSPLNEVQNKRIITKNLVSIHEYGCAFDFAITRDGKAIWDVKADVDADQVPDYEEAGRIGEALGLRWGGRFTFKDYCHLEYTGGLSLASLKAGQRPVQRRLT